MSLKSLLATSPVAAISMSVLDMKNGNIGGLTALSRDLTGESTYGTSRKVAESMGFLEQGRAGFRQPQELLDIYGETGSAAKSSAAAETTGASNSTVPATFVEGGNSLHQDLPAFQHLRPKLPTEPVPWGFGAAARAHLKDKKLLAPPDAGCNPKQTDKEGKSLIKSGALAWLFKDMDLAIADIHLQEPLPTSAVNQIQDAVNHLNKVKEDSVADSLGADFSRLVTNLTKILAGAGEMTLNDALLLLRDLLSSMLTNPNIGSTDKEAIGDDISTIDNVFEEGNKAGRKWKKGENQAGDSKPKLGGNATNETNETEQTGAAATIGVSPVASAISVSLIAAVTGLYSY